MASLFDKQLDVFENSIQAGLDSNFNKLVNDKMKKVQKAMELLQDDFFTIMALKINGADGPPNLGAYTPSWKQLDEDYVDQRAFDQDVPEDQFFRYSGKMETTLKRLKPRTFLGKPTVTYKRGKFQQKTQVNYTAPKRSVLNEPLKALVQIDLFPKLTGSISEIDEESLFDDVKLTWVTERRVNVTTTTPLSYRFKSFKGNRDRPVVVEYFNWWLNVKAKKALREIVR